MTPTLARYNRIMNIGLAVAMVLAMGIIAASVIK